MTLQEIGKSIRKRREQLKMHRDELATFCGISSKTIYLIEHAKGKTSFNTMGQVLDVLGMEMIVQIRKS
jgi:DNA-binding XRE family transcriptional regulator